MHTIAKNSTLRLLFIALCLVFVTGATSVNAWTGPTAPPPGNNTGAPINVGDTDQIKNASLGVNGLIVFGNSLLGGGANTNAYLNWGAISGTNGYGIRDRDGTLQFKNLGGTWQSLQDLVGGGGISGSGNTSYIPRWTGATSLGNSSITSDGVSATANGNFFVTNNLTVAGQNVCRQDGTFCPAAGAVAWANITGKPYPVNGQTWNWAGQGGQPTWLWGSNDGQNMYVWNPSNFNVSYVGGYSSEALLKYDTWGRGSTYYASNGDMYMPWAGQWLSQYLNYLNSKYHPNQNVDYNSNPTFNTAYVTTLCLSGVCRNTWPGQGGSSYAASGGGNNWATCYGGSFITAIAVNWDMSVSVQCTYF